MLELSKRFLPWFLGSYKKKLKSKKQKKRIGFGGKCTLLVAFFFFVVLHTEKELLWPARTMFLLNGTDLFVHRRIFFFYCSLFFFFFFLRFLQPPAVNPYHNSGFVSAILCYEFHGRLDSLLSPPPRPHTDHALPVH